MRGNIIPCESGVATAVWWATGYKFIDYSNKEVVVVVYSSIKGHNKLACLSTEISFRFKF